MNPCATDDIQFGLRSFNCSKMTSDSKYKFPADPSFVYLFFESFSVLLNSFSYFRKNVLFIQLYLQQNEGLSLKKFVSVKKSFVDYFQPLIIYLSTPLPNTKNTLNFNKLKTIIHCWEFSVFIEICILTNIFSVYLL